MMPGRAAIFVATEPLDLRRSFDGLAAVARDVMGQDPLSGALFLFFNRAHDRVKVLWWDRSGYCILYKRLERGAFRVPRAMSPNGTHVTIDASELAKILEGIALPPSQQRVRGQHALAAAALL